MAQFARTVYCQSVVLVTPDLLVFASTQHIKRDPEPELASRATDCLQEQRGVGPNITLVSSTSCRCWLTTYVT